MLRNGFHATLGDRVRTRDALQIASSLFYDGIERFDSGENDDALARFEQALAINQSCTKQSSTAYILCCNNIAAVHARLGKPRQVNRSTLLAAAPVCVLRASR